MAVKVLAFPFNQTGLPLSVLLSVLLPARGLLHWLIKLFSSIQLPLLSKVLKSSTFQKPKNKKKEGGEEDNRIFTATIHSLVPTYTAKASQIRTGLLGPMFPES